MSVKVPSYRDIVDSAVKNFNTQETEQETETDSAEEGEESETED